MKLLVTVERDETGTFVVECPSIPGCISQGKTEQEAIANIREAIVGCLETRAANQMPLNRRRPRGGSQPLMAQLPSISGAEAVRAFKCAGWLEDRQRGSPCHSYQNRPSCYLIDSLTPRVSTRNTPRYHPRIRSQCRRICRPPVT